MITSRRTALEIHAAPESSRERAHRPTPISARVNVARRVDRAPRRGLIRRIQGQIRTGTYDEDRRVDALLDALAEDLGLTSIPAIRRAEGDAWACRTTCDVYAIDPAPRAKDHPTATEPR